MLTLKKVAISFVKGTRENVDCLFSDNEKLKEILLGNSNQVIVGINIPIGIDELIIWKGGVLNVLESMGARNINIGTNIHSPNSYITGENDKLVSASITVEYFKIMNYDNDRKCKKVLRHFKWKNLKSISF